MKTIIKERNNSTLNQDLKEEIKELKRLPTNKLYVQLGVYKLLYILNGDVFMFLFSLVSCFIPLLFFKFSIITYSLALCMHLFIWQKVKPMLDKRFKTLEEQQETKEIIFEIKKELKTRK